MSRGAQVSASRRGIGSLMASETWVIAGMYTLWTLPIAFGARTNWALRSAPVILVAILLGGRILFEREPLRFPARSLGSWLLALYLATWLIAFARTLTLGVLTLDGLFILGYAGFLVVFLTFLAHRLGQASHDRARAQALQLAALSSAGIYLAANVAGFVAGLRQPDPIYLAEYPAQMLSSVGTVWNRTLFPMADGINAFGVFAGLVLVGAAHVLLGRRGLAVATLAGAAACGALAVILMADSRGALLFSALTLAITAFSGKLQRYTRWLPLLVSFTPLLVTAAAPAWWFDVRVLERPTGTMDAATRTALEAELCREGTPAGGGILSNRSLVWQTGLRELWPPQIEDLVGYGFRGQVVAGATAKLECLFLSFVQRHLVSMHNVWLQSLFETGYLGTLILLGLTIWLVCRLSALSAGPGDVTHGAMLGALQYLVLAGSLEATLSPDYGATFVLFLVTAILALFTQGASPTRPES